jgi:hypothetical protein
MTVRSVASSLKTDLKKISPPLVGGDKGEGEEDEPYLFTPTPTLPHERGRGIDGKIWKSNLTDFISNLISVPRSRDLR